jgi:hypothetical protein
MTILHLTLKKKWFDMIASGKKTEEYRDIKNYWMTRLLTPRKGVQSDQFPWGIGFYAGTFSHVQFRNGYSKTSPKMVFKSDGVGVFYGIEEWGAEPGKKYFVIKLGERVS